MGQQNAEQGNEELLVHPWVIPAVLGMEPDPVPTQVKLDAVEIHQDEKTQKSALLTVVTPSGITTVFLPENTLHGLMRQGAEILMGWEQERNNGLIIATPEMMKVAREAAEQQNKLRGA